MTFCHNIYVSVTRCRYTHIPAIKHNILYVQFPSYATMRYLAEVHKSAYVEHENLDN